MNAAVEKFDALHSKLLYRIEQVEKRVAENSEENRRQKKEIECHTKQIECHTKQIESLKEHQHEQKENYLEFAEKKGMVLCSY